MSYFAVIREHGAGWDTSRGLREQEQWTEHAELMDAWAAEGFVVLGGPLADGSRVLLVIDAESEDEITTRLAADPWTPMGLLRTTSIEGWDVLLRHDA